MRIWFRIRLDRIIQTHMQTIMALQNGDELCLSFKRESLSLRNQSKIIKPSTVVLFSTASNNNLKLTTNKASIRKKDNHNLKSTWQALWETFQKVWSLMKTMTYLTASLQSGLTIDCKKCIFTSKMSNGQRQHTTRAKSNRWQKT